jgi:DNA mismatch repair enzyme (predicted ATPase)
MTIHRLAPELIERMAAGEVIDSLVAVVRELVENALDAQATHLRLRLEPDGVRLADTVRDDSGNTHPGGHGPHH